MTDTHSLTEQLAIAVLRKDAESEATARALVDLLLETWKDTVRPIQPIRRLPADVGRIRVVVYVSDNAEMDQAYTNDEIHRWLTEGRPLLLQGIARIELYELAGE